MPVALDIADAVVAELAGAPAETFNQAFTPQRLVLPQFELAELKDLKVTVVPRSVEITNVSRAHSQHGIQIDIGIQKRLA